MVLNQLDSVRPNTLKHIGVIGIKGLPSKGGAERVAEAIIDRALREGYKVTVYCKNSNHTNYSFPNNLRLIWIRDFKGKHLNAFLYGLFSAVHALVLGRYDLIHLHCADFGYLVPLLRLRFKVLGTSHGAEYNRDKWGRFAKMALKFFEILFVKYVHVCTSVSKSLADYYLSRYRKPIFYIPNGIHFNEGRTKLRIDELKDYNLNPNGYMLFCAGRIIPSKGCDILLKANQKIEGEVPLVIIGKVDDIEYKKYLNSLFKNNVRFIDFIASKEKLFNVIGGCKFFIFPSTYEAMSMMLLEVALLKKGIICSDIPENRETISEYALYFKSGDSGDLAEKIRYAIHHEEDMNFLGEKAYKWVIENRNWEDLNYQYIKLYKMLIEE